MDKIYLDNAATTELDKKVEKAMKPYYREKYGNASSQHHLGQEANRALERARNVIAKELNAKKDEIVFTSGGTESNNLALKGLAFMDQKKTGKKRHLITTKIEHDCVLNASKWLKEKGWKVTFLDVDEEGFVDPDSLEDAINEDTFLVSIIYGNNEIGTIQDLEELCKMCKENDVLFHTDACQSFTKTDLDVNKHNLDLVTLNAHKIHGPKGVGALYIREGTKITPIQHGGGHEQNRRSGTENVSGIVGFAEAVKQASKKDRKRMAELRDKLITNLDKIEGSILNGPQPGNDRLCNNVNFIFKGVEGEAIGGHLDSYGICSSTGSACSSHSLEPSHVLLAIGRSKSLAHGSIRLSIGKYNTEEEIDKVIEVMPKIIKKLRKISPFEKIIDKV